MSNETSRTLEIVQWSQKNKQLKTCEQSLQQAPAKCATLLKMKQIAWVKWTHGQQTQPLSQN